MLFHLLKHFAVLFFMNFICKTNKYQQKLSLRLLSFIFPLIFTFSFIFLKLSKVTLSFVREIIIIQINIVAVLSSDIIFIYAEQLFLVRIPPP